MEKPIKLPVAIRECAGCGGKYVPTGHNQKYCPDCRRKQMTTAREKSPRGHAGQPYTPQPAFASTLEWYRPEDKLPDTSQKVFYISESGCSIDTVAYSARHNAFNASDNRPTTEHAFKVAYWAAIPDTINREMENTMTQYFEKKKEDN